MSARKDSIRVSVVAPGPGDGPNWYYLVRQPRRRPRRQSSGTTDRNAAEAEARAMEARMNARLAPRSGEDPLILTVYDRHVAFREGDPLTRPNTLRTYRAVRGAVARAFDGCRASALDTATVRAAQRKLLALPLEASTANMYLQKVAHAWKWAREAKHSGVGEWPKVDELPANVTAKRQYTPEEMERVLVEAQRYAAGRYLPLLCFLGENGARISEACALRGRDVDRKRGLVTLTATKRMQRTRSRTVPVTPEVMAMLPERRPLEWVFRSTYDPGQPMPPRSVLTALATIRERAGLGDEPLDLHSFRRYVVRKLHSAGVPLRDAMAIVGHESVAVHLSYMRDVPPVEAHAHLARARATHDHLAALSPGRVPGRVGGRKCRISSTGKASLTSAPTRELSAAGLDPGRARDADRDGSRVESVHGGRPRAVIRLSRTPEGRQLAPAFLRAPEALKRAMLALAQDDDVAAAFVRSIASGRYAHMLEARPARRRAQRAGS